MHLPRPRGLANWPRRPRISQEVREQRELAYWNATQEGLRSNRVLQTLTNKMSEGRVLLEKFALFEAEFSAAHTILEVGGGQLWVSCMIKERFGQNHVVFGSDISPAAVAESVEWQRVLRQTLDGVFACRSYEIPLTDESVDLVIVFAAAHHFGAHKRTLAELHRVLRPGGTVLYLHEPSCPDYIYRPALRRVNAKRPVVQEDLLRYRNLIKISREAGLSVSVRHAPTTTHRGPIETVYYLALQKFAVLQQVLPCTVDIVIKKL